jgi:RNA polymerase sigma-70 factor, ECF subfamily
MVRRLCCPRAHETPHQDADDHLACILRRLNCGEEAAFTELFEAVHPRLVRYAQFLVADPSHAEEVASDVLRQVWSKPGAYDAQRASVSSWLTMLTRSRAVDHLRRRKRCVDKPSQHPEVNDFPCQQETPEQRLIRVCRHGRLAKTLLDLQPAQQNLLHLAFYEGRTHKEIAEITGLPLGTVKTRIRSALQKLRHHLGDILEANSHAPTPLSSTRPVH